MAIFNSYVSLPEGKALDLRYICEKIHGFSSHGGVSTRYNHGSGHKPRFYHGENTQVEEISDSPTHEDPCVFFMGDK